MVPEFRELLTRDKRSKGDYRGDKKLKAIAEFTFIFFYTDFSSPIRDYADDERQKESLYYAGLTEDQLDDKVWAAQRKYHQVQLESSRPLRTLKALYKGMDAMDEYFEDIDFKRIDKQGKLLNDPSAFVNNAAKLRKMYQEIREFEKMVEDDMKQAVAGIRGPNSSLGDKEGQPSKFSESDIIKGSQHIAGEGIKTSGSFSDILKVTRQMAVQERATATREQEVLEHDEDELTDQ
jgi:uncharacterized protein YbjQ (UPF0145 family)